ncbi:hypothetical protein RCIP0095_00036 [Klebsiella phage RCIP0095]
MNRNICIFDLDGTLSNGNHRLHLLPKKDLHLTESWTAFNMAAGGDAPHYGHDPGNEGHAHSGIYRHHPDRAK